MALYKDIREMNTKTPLLKIIEIAYGIESENYYAAKNKQQLININEEISKPDNDRIFIKSDKFSEEMVNLLYNDGTEIVILPASAHTEKHLDKADRYAHEMTCSYSIQMIC